MNIKLWVSFEKISESELFQLKCLAKSLSKKKSKNDFEKDDECLKKLINNAV